MQSGEADSRNDPTAFLRRHWRGLLLSWGICLVLLWFASCAPEWEPDEGKPSPIVPQRQDADRSRTMPADEGIMDALTGMSTWLIASLIMQVILVWGSAAMAYYAYPRKWRTKVRKGPDGTEERTKYQPMLYKVLPVALVLFIYVTAAAVAGLQWHGHRQTYRRAAKMNLLPTDEFSDLIKVQQRAQHLDLIEASPELFQRVVKASKGKKREEVIRIVTDELFECLEGVEHLEIFRKYRGPGNRPLSEWMYLWLRRPGGSPGAGGTRQVIEAVVTGVINENPAWLAAAQNGDMSKLVRLISSTCSQPKEELKVLYVLNDIARIRLRSGNTDLKRRMLKAYAEEMGRAAPE